MGEGRVGVLAMAYGTPASPADVEAYYTHIRRGRPPTPDQLADLIRRYDAIGGTSPLLQRTRAQVGAIGRALGPDFVVELGMKHAAPFVEDAARSLSEAGVSRVVGLVLAPHYSASSVGEYAARARAATEVPLTMVESWWDVPAYIELLSQRVEHALAEVPAGAEVVFTAHSLPRRILDTGDPYPDQVRATAEAVSARAGVERWSQAWQSAGRTPEPWLGPDITGVIRDRAAAGVPGLVVCPCGFVADHLEVLYDIDVEAASLASELGLPLARTAMPNDHPGLMGALADVVRSKAGRA